LSFGIPLKDMVGKLDKVLKFKKEHEKVTGIAQIISNHFDIASDDDKVLETADEIYRYLFGNRVRIDP
jgi:hypothetical protein